MQILRSLVPLLSLLAIVPAAQAIQVVVPVNNEILFTGVCADCYSGAGDAYAFLFLTGVNQAGDPLTSSNFVSFDYEGTDKEAAFEIDNGDPDFSVSGTIPTLVGPGDITIEGDGYTFSSSSAGNWSVSYNSSWNQMVNQPGPGGVPYPPSDYGYSSSYSDAPEPATISLIGLGLAGALFTRRKLRSRI